MWPSLRLALCQNKGFPKKVWFCCWGSSWWDWLIWGLTCRIWTNEWSACLWDSLPRIPVWFLGNLYLPHHHHACIHCSKINTNTKFTISPICVCSHHCCSSPELLENQTPYPLNSEWLITPLLVLGLLKGDRCQGVWGWGLWHILALCLFCGVIGHLSLLDIRCHSTPFCGEYP